MQNAIKLENISNLITSPSTYPCRKTTVNMKVSGFCYYMDFYYWLPPQSISQIFPTRIEIFHGNHSLYNVLTWVRFFSFNLVITV